MHIGDKAFGRFYVDQNAAMLDTLLKYRSYINYEMLAIIENSEVLNQHLLNLWEFIIHEATFHPNSGGDQMNCEFLLFKNNDECLHFKTMFPEAILYDGI